jgi:hypothetical protein
LSEEVVTNRLFKTSDSFNDNKENTHFVKRFINAFLRGYTFLYRSFSGIWDEKNIRGDGCSERIIRIVLGIKAKKENEDTNGK